MSAGSLLSAVLVLHGGVNIRVTTLCSDVAKKNTKPISGFKNCRPSCTPRSCSPRHMTPSDTSQRAMHELHAQNEQPVQAPEPNEDNHRHPSRARLNGFGSREQLKESGVALPPPSERLAATMEQSDCPRRRDNAGNLHPETPGQAAGLVSLQPPNPRGRRQDRANLNAE